MTPVEQSLSPSMDIQVSSNFERVLFELLDRDPAATAAHDADVPRTGRMTVPDMPGAARARCSTAFAWTMRAPRRRSAGCTKPPATWPIPHTAVGIAAARALPPAPAIVDRGDGDGAPGQVSRRDRASGGMASAAAAAPGGPVRPGGAVPGAAERTRRGGGGGAGAHPAQYGGPSRGTARAVIEAASPARHRQRPVLRGRAGGSRQGRLMPMLMPGIPTPPAAGRSSHRREEQSRRGRRHNRAYASRDVRSAAGRDVPVVVLCVGGHAADRKRGRQAAKSRGGVAWFVSFWAMGCCVTPA